MVIEVARRMCAEPGREELGRMSPAEFVARLRAALAEPGRGMLNHPFVEAVEAGTATLPQIRAVTEQFYLHIRNMLPWIGMMFVKCPYEAVRAALVRNLAEECLGIVSGTKAHPDLMLDFAAAVGCDIAALRQAEQNQVGRNLTQYFELMGTQRPWFVPLAAIGIGLESFVPVTFRRLVNGFKRHYGLSDADVFFWEMHIKADTEHGDEAIDLIARYVQTPVDRQTVYQCTLETGERFYALWDLYRTAA